MNDYVTLLFQPLPTPTPPSTPYTMAAMAKAAVPQARVRSNGYLVEVTVPVDDLTVFVDNISAPHYGMRYVPKAQRAELDFDPGSKTYPDT